jgi:hypothetical protein
MQNLWYKQLIFKHHRCVTHFFYCFSLSFYFSRQFHASESSEDAKPAYSVGQGILAKQKLHLRESALHFELSIQSTSAKICVICGRKTSIVPRKGAKEAKEAKIASARICFTLRIKHTINIRENLRNLREKKLRFFPRKDAKEAKAQKLHLRESALHFELSIQSTSAKVCAICRRQNFASSILGLWFSYRPSTVDHRLYSSYFLKIKI